MSTQGGLGFRASAMVSSSRCEKGTSREGGRLLGAVLELVLGDAGHSSSRRNLRDLPPPRREKEESTKRNRRSGGGLSPGGGIKNSRVKIRLNRKRGGLGDWGGRGAYKRAERIQSKVYLLTKRPGGGGGGGGGGGPWRGGVGICVLQTAGSLHWGVGWGWCFKNVKVSFGIASDGHITKTLSISGKVGETRRQLSTKKLCER